MSLVLDRPASVYELWSGDECLYVGCTVNLRKRLSDHTRYFHGWARVTEVKVREFPTHGKALAAEAALIYKMRPSGNLRHNPDYDRGLCRLPKRIAKFEERLAAGIPAARTYLSVGATSP